MQNEYLLPVGIEVRFLKEARFLRIHSFINLILLLICEYMFDMINVKRRSEVERDSF